MLAKRYHLPIQSATAGASRSVRSTGLTLKIFTTDLPYGRFGVIIPKAIAQKAVLRNLLKRVAFDSYAPYHSKLSGRDVLCIASRGAPLTKDAMMKELHKLFSGL